MSFTDGRSVPEAILTAASDGSNVRVGIGATVTSVPNGYTATIDAFGNLTVTGPAAHAVAVSGQLVGGVAWSAAVDVAPTVQALSDVRDLAQAALPASSLAAAVAALLTSQFPSGLTTDAELTTAVANAIAAEVTRANAAYIAGTGMAADLSAAGHRITNLLDPTSPQDAATRAYVLAQLSALVNGAPALLDTLGEIAAQLATTGFTTAAVAVEAAARAAQIATSVSVATFDAAGDLLVGTGNDVYAKLTKGSALQVLRVKSDGSTLEYATPAPGGSVAKTTVAASGTTQTLTMPSSGENAVDVTLTGNCTFTLAGTPASSELCAMNLRLTQDGTGGRTVTWPASVLWYGGTAPALSSGAGRIDRLVLETWDGGATYLGSLVGQGAYVPTTPGAPSGVTATAGNATATIGWTTPGTGGSPITGYKVYRGTTSGGETLLTTLGLVNTFGDTGLTNGTAYYYKVAAVNAIGTGPQSSEATCTPSGITTYITETWNRTVSTAALGTCSTGQAWNSNTPPYMDVTPNYASPNAANGVLSPTVHCSIDTGHADFSVSWTLTTFSANMRWYFRTDGNANFWNFGSATGFYKNGSTNIGGTTAAFSAGDVIKVVCSGSTITMFQNGTQIKQITDATNSTLTKVGIGMVPTAWAETTARFGPISVTS